MGLMLDIIIAKIRSVQRCVFRVREEYLASDGDFAEDYTHQDAAILNLLRACEICVDLANYVLKERKLGIPNSSSDSFRILSENKIIQSDLANKMIRITSLRNRIMHQYQNINAERIENVITDEMNSFQEFTEAIIAYINETGAE